MLLFEAHEDSRFIIGYIDITIISRRSFGLTRNYIMYFFPLLVEHAQQATCN